MPYIPRNGDYLKILTNDEEKNFAVINFVSYFEPMEKNFVLN